MPGGRTDNVVVLGQMARNVLADLSQVNQTALGSDYKDGDKALLQIDTGAAALSSRLQCTPWPSTITSCPMMPQNP